MKIRIYTKPGVDPNSYADAIQKVVHDHTGKVCIVKFVGDPTRPVKVDLGENE